MKRFVSRSLQGKLLLALLPAALIITILASVTFGFFKYQDLHDELSQKSVELADQYATALSATLWNYDLESLQKILDVLTKGEDIYRIAIYSVENKLLVDANSPMAAVTRPWITSERAIEFQTISQYHTLGVIKVTLHDDRLLDIITSEIIRESLTSVALIITIILSIVFAYRAYIYRPLRRLSSAFIHTKNLKELPKVEWQSDDELGVLVGGYENMRMLLQSEGRALHESEKRFRTLQEASSSGILIHDGERIIDVNKSLLDITGFTSASLIGGAVLDLVDDKWHTRFSELSNDPSASFTDMEGKRSNGESYPIELIFKRIPYGGREVIISELRDLTDRRETEERIHFLAYYDSLTELPNRQHLIDRLDNELIRLSRDKQQIAVHFLDLNKFKSINDSFGHPTGDRLLVAVAKRLKSLIRVTDICARMGGDEFVIVQTDVERDVDAAVLATKIIRELEKPFEMDGNMLYTGVTIGIMLCKGEGYSAQGVLQKADIALYHAKDKRRGYALHSEEMSQSVYHQVQIGNDLKAALQSEDQLYLVYQPQIDLKSGQIIGVEALIRWMHPKRGLVLPGEFIHIAEDQGLIRELGFFVLRSACDQQMRWKKDHGLSLSIAVNVSADQLSQKDFLTTLQDIVDGREADPRLLELEITESVLIEDPEGILKILDTITMLGIRVSIDDFGTGFSSLEYLKLLPIDKVKIAQEFVRDFLVNSNDKAIVSAILSLSASFGITSLAEGVESAEQMEQLFQIGCQQAQGYYFSRPVSPDEIVSLISGRNH